MSAFSLSRLLLVARKELLDLLRDRKSIFWALFTVVISGPLVVGLLYFVGKTVSDRIEKVTAPIVNAQFAPDLVRFLERRGVKIDADPADYEARVKSGDLDAVLVVDPGYAESLGNGRSAKITLVTLSSRDGSAPIGKRGFKPTRRRRPTKRLGPTSASTLTAGMLSEWASASRTDTVPRKSSSKLVGA